jgi:hypothetical protein
MAVVKVPVRIGLIGHRRMSWMRVMFLMQEGCGAIMDHIGGVEHAFEPGRKQTHNDEHYDRISHGGDPL